MLDNEPNGFKAGSGEVLEGVEEDGVAVESGGDEVVGSSNGADGIELNRSEVGSGEALALVKGVASVVEESEVPTKSTLDDVLKRFEAKEVVEESEEVENGSSGKSDEEASVGGKVEGTESPKGL